MSIRIDHTHLSTSFQHHFSIISTSFDDSKPTAINAFIRRLLYRMPCNLSPCDVPNPYHPWIQGYDYYDPLENDDDALDHERLEGVQLEKERLYAGC